MWATYLSRGSRSVYAYGQVAQLVERISVWKSKDTRNVVAGSIPALPTISDRLCSID